MGDFKGVVQYCGRERQDADPFFWCSQCDHGLWKIDDEVFGQCKFTLRKRDVKAKGLYDSTFTDLNAQSRKGKIWYEEETVGKI